jgi:hypothetical protein
MDKVDLEIFRELLDSEETKFEPAVDLRTLTFGSV